MATINDFLMNPPKPGALLAFSTLPKSCRGCAGPTKWQGSSGRSCKGGYAWKCGSCRLWRGELIYPEYDESGVKLKVAHPPV